jgi:hypothetical protein
VRDRLASYVGLSSDYHLHSRSLMRSGMAPPVRYNRVEGLVLGLRRAPLDATDEEAIRFYGQVGYAFALQRLRYTAGVETRVYRTPASALKIGLAYRNTTLTNDAWKASWTENSLAASLFGYDFFDYYAVEGPSLYAVHRLSPDLQVRAGFRAETYRSLTQQATWRLFGGRALGSNPAITPGQMRSVVLAAQSGQIRDRAGLPAGAAARVTAELGRGLGGDFSFNRYVADGRVFLPVTGATRLGLRLRAGYATAGTPLQKQFTIGGRGSVRGYPQNGFGGTRLVLGNAEYRIRADDGLFDDLLLIGFADAGWVGAPGTTPTLDAVQTAVGVGLGLDDHPVRLDVAFPLRSAGAARPVVSLRLTPTF